MSAYNTFTTARGTEADPATLLAQLRALDATAGVQHFPGPTYTLKKATAWTGPQITAAQNVLDTAPATTPQLTAQTVIDNMPIETKAICLALIDQLNVIRNLLPLPLGAITPAAAIAAIRVKALGL
jgi:hypothetical protein